MQTASTLVIVLPHWLVHPTAAGEETALGDGSAAHFDELARDGVAARLRMSCPPGLATEAAILSLLGQDDLARRLSPGALLAAARGLELSADTLLAVAQFLRIEDGHPVPWPTREIPSSDEARAMLESVTQAIGSPSMSVHASADGWHSLAWNDAQSPFLPETLSWPLSALWGETLEDAFCRGPGSELLHGWMDTAHRTLAGTPAQGLWIWGVGRPLSAAPQPGTLPQVHWTTRSPLQAGVARMLGGEFDLVTEPGPMDLARLAFEAGERLRSGRGGWTILAVDGPPDHSAYGKAFVKPEDRHARVDGYDEVLLAELIAAVRSAGEGTRLVLAVSPPDDAGWTSPEDVLVVAYGPDLEPDAETTFSAQCGRTSSPSEFRSRVWGGSSSVLR